MTAAARLPIEPPSLPQPRAASASFGAFHAPRSLSELLALRAERPDALLLAGATDLGLLASRSRKPPAALIHVAHVPELRMLQEDGDSVTIGAAVSYAEAMALLVAHFPALRPYLSRLGSRQIRTMGTLGGNIGTASPIGDMPPVLIALEATLSLASRRGTRHLPLEEFFLGYRKTALAPDEVITGITLPKLWRGEVFFCDKLSKRRDQDISTLAAGYRLRLHDGKIEDVRIGFGGMAATPKRAVRIEQALTGQAFSAATFEAAATAVVQEFRPIDDWRGSADYRLRAAANLLRRLYWRIAEPESVVEVEAL
jgi:xanthine dehydrogenase small subunit